ncbi:hypothetical protein RF11_03918 [Thelohanellus kitauei]|nr:hypothetical protein RF11_03918 [Thelohanellus kitauei]
MAFDNRVSRDFEARRNFIIHALSHFQAIDHPYTRYLTNHLNQVLEDRGVGSTSITCDPPGSCPLCGFLLKPDTRMSIKQRKDVYNLMKQKVKGWKAYRSLLESTPKKSIYLSYKCEACSKVVFFKLDRTSQTKTPVYSDPRLKDAIPKPKRNTSKTAKIERKTQPKPVSSYLKKSNSQNSKKLNTFLTFLDRGR